MEQADTLLKVYGTSEPPQAMRQVTIGALSFLYSQDGLRRICWQGTELVRALAWPMRDESWGTYPAEILEETVDESDGFTAALTFSVGNGRLVCDLKLQASAEGEVLADLTMSPKNGPFATNRSGFTVLHPIKGFAGAPLDVTHSDGSTETTTFPRHIQPDQPVKDIAGLRYGTGQQSVDMVFEQEVFEMEDQRNWSDASYKTYCVPLVHPFVYDITRPLQQKIRMTFAGDGSPPSVGSEQGSIGFETSGARAPDIGLALQSGWLPKSSVPALDATHVLLRTFPGDQDLAKLASFARGYAGVDLEIVVPDDMPVERGLQRVAKGLSAEGIVANRVIALRASYLGSHQPVGPWPEGATPNEMLPTVEAVFPNAAIGGGMMTNFTELNRCRPDIARCDYITHGLTPLVHAGDDMSVLETLEALPQIFTSAEALADGRPYRLGLASIGMRSNPYGAAVAENPNQVRRTMGRIDPRHRGLFGAAFATGVLAATEGSAVQALCLGAPGGPFALMYEATDYPQAGYDQSGRAVYPLFHVVRAACAMAGHPRLAFGDMPDGVVGYGAIVGDTTRFMLANVSDRSRTATLRETANILRLDADSFDAATRSADWLDSAAQTNGSELELPPFSVAFLSTSTAKAL